jgi:nicotinate-nucleotide--dimethylbenzimidazole phosphoribosyltransferase
MANSRSLVTPTSSPLLEKALRDKLQRRNDLGGGLGQLEPLAVRLGLMHDTLRPQLHHPRLLVFAADHGLAVDSIADPRLPTTHDTVERLLTKKLPLTAFAGAQQVAVTVVDCGMADIVAPHDRLLQRKIAHATRNSRASPAWSLPTSSPATSPCWRALAWALTKVLRWCWRASRTARCATSSSVVRRWNLTA